MIDSTISVLSVESRVLPNRRPRIGRLPKPGTLLPLVRSSLLIRPASTWFSPSFSCSMVVAERVPMRYATEPDLVVIESTRFDTSSEMRIATSLFR